MISRFRLPLAAALLVTCTTGAALAGPAVLSTDMTLRNGPGDEFASIALIPGGSQVDLRECNFDQWCNVEHRNLSGWIHVRAVEEPQRRGGGSGGAGSPGDTASGGSTGLPGDSGQPGDPGGKKGGSRPSHSSTDNGNSNSSTDSGNSGMSPTDSASLPGNSDTAGDRLSASGGGGGRF